MKAEAKMIGQDIIWQAYTRAEADGDPTPRMEDVKVKRRNGGIPFVFGMLPDTGCTQSLMVADLASQYGMVINTQELDCSGTVTFDVEFEGCSVEVVALGSSSINSEVILSWRMLQELRVIPEGFPWLDTTTKNGSLPSGPE